MPRRQEFKNLYKMLNGQYPDAYLFDALSEREQKDWIMSMKESLAVELNKLVKLGAKDWTQAKRWMLEANNN